MGVPEAPRRQEWVPVRPQVEMAAAETHHGAHGPTPTCGLPMHTSWSQLLVRRAPVFRAVVNPQPSRAD